MDLLLTRVFNKWWSRCRARIISQTEETMFGLMMDNLSWVGMANSIYGVASDVTRMFATHVSRLHYKYQTRDGKSLDHDKGCAR